MENTTTALSENAPSIENGASAQQMLDYSNLSLKEIVEKFEKMLETGDQQELYKYADVLKASFYKVLRREKISAGVFDVDNPVDYATLAEPEGSQPEEKAEVNAGEETVQNESGKESDSERNPFIDIEIGFKRMYAKYKELRTQFIEKEQKEKEENLAIKQEVVNQINSLLEKAEDLTLTVPAFKELQARWKSVGQVPIQKSKELWESYSRAVEKFYDYIKINNEFRDLDFKKNLESKQGLCQKAKELLDYPSVVNAFRELQKLHEDWKEIGPVAKEFRESIWEEFKDITAQINKKHQAFFENLKNEQRDNLVAKTALCEQAEQIASNNPDNSNEWNSLTKSIEELQVKWKSIGFASKKDNQKIYDRFRAACDKFFEAKRVYYSNFKDVMSQNLQKKESLCEQAEAISKSEEWKDATDKLIALQNEWKEVGPVPRKYSDAVWKRFRAACDLFFENKAQHFGKAQSKFEDNLAAKQALIDEVTNFVPSGNHDEDLASMRAFLDRWNAIGFVPFKAKDKIAKAWNAALDVHFAQLRNNENEVKLNKFRKKISDMKNNGGSDRAIRSEREKLIQKFHKLEQEVATLENNKGFFAKSRNAQSIIDEIDSKIAAARDEIKQLEEKIKLIENQYE